MTLRDATDLHPDVAAAVEEIAAFGRFAAARGWVPATAGNFSVRVREKYALVTCSGIDKGNVGRNDCAIVPLAGPIPAGLSAETPLHLARYNADPSIGAIVHVHTLPATVLSRLDQDRGSVALDGYEMLKALGGITSHLAHVDLPVFGNDQDTSALAQRVELRLASRFTEFPVPGYLLAGHGLYAWGATMSEARRHAEGLEFLLAATLEERRLQR